MSDMEMGFQICDAYKFEIQICDAYKFANQGLRRGGQEGAIAPHGNMLAARRKVKNYFSEIFGNCSILEPVF